jgi:hypothetical protein
MLGYTLMRCGYCLKFLSPAAEKSSPIGRFGCPQSPEFE